MTDVHTRVFKELSEFFSEPLEFTKWKCNQKASRVFEQWNMWNPKTESERKEFYLINPSNLYGTANWHSEGNAPQQRMAIAQSCHGKVLNFGCGIGTEGLYAAELGCVVDFYDVGVAAKFMEYRLKRSGLSSVKMVKTFDKYDTIVCIDVLEHLGDPYSVLYLFKDLLNEDGILLVEAPFNEYDTPSHLAEHKDLNIINMLKEVGIKRYKTNLLHRLPGGYICG